MKYTGNLITLSALLASFSVFAAGLPDNVDGDLIPDATESWLIGQGVTQDDGGQPINAGGAANNYQDDDADGIPDLVETYITHTRTNQADNVLKNCPGDGTDNLTGQYGLRIAPVSSLNGRFVGHNILLQKISGISICHSGTNSFDVYHPELGYANSVNFNSGTRALTVSWSMNSTTMNAIYFDNGTPDKSDDRLDGNLDTGATWVENGNVNDMRSSFHDRLDTAYAGEIEAIYGMQLKLLDKVSDYGAVNSPLNPGSTSFQLDVLADGVSAVIYESDGNAGPAWFVPSVGAFHARSRSIITGLDLDADSLNDDKQTDDQALGGLFTRSPVSGAGGRFRGFFDLDRMVDLDYLSSPGTDSRDSTGMDVFAAAQVAMFRFWTESNEAGQQQTWITLHNVPVSATKITLTGSGAAAGFGSIDLTDNSVFGKTLEDLIRIRNRVPGFTDDPNIGMAGDGTKHRIAALSYKSVAGTLAPDGVYTFSFTGDAAGTPPVADTYTSVPPNEILPAAQNLQWNGSPMSSLTPLTGVNPDVDHVLSWDRITSGGTLGTGAFRYEWIAARTGAKGNVNFLDANRLSKFRDDKTGKCPASGSRCSLTIKAGTFMPDTGYCFTLLSRSNGNGENRSRTNKYCLTTRGEKVNNDLVIDFGGIGLWARMNDASWLKLNNSSPDQMVVGDMDGNGEDDVVADFGSGIGGIFVKRNLGGWSKLHNSSPELLAVGDLDNNGQDDIIIDFGAIGLWARMNDVSWLKLNNASPVQVLAGDMDGNGADDVIAVFGSGIFVKRNLGGWSKLHNSIPERMMVGDLDNNGQDDIIIDFGSIGLWARMNDASWLKLHNNSPGLIATGDIDGNGADDVLATFAGQGLWLKLDLGGWSKLNNNGPDELVTGDVNGGGKDDIIADFGTTLGGIFVKRDQGAWVKLHNTSPDSMAAGNLDGN